VEPLESRCLLSAAPAAVLANIGGQTFNGTIHLHFHATSTAAGHSQALPVSLAFNSVVDGAISGSETGGGRGAAAAFSGTAHGRKFDAAFADATGSISGRFGHQAMR